METLMKSFILFLSFVCVTASSLAEDRVYVGPWRTTNRPLNGIMTAVVTDLGNNQWQGRFYGVWEGVAFDYTVRFSGPADMMKGAAVIDNANYTWIGRMNEHGFNGTFTGDRYTGYFRLLPKK